MKEKTVADGIVEKAKGDLIKLITFGVALIHNAVGNESEDGETYIEGDDLKWKPLIEVSVDESYLDVYDDISERREVTKICVCDGQSYVETAEGDEIYCENLSVEELRNIANCIRESFQSITTTE